MNKALFLDRDGVINIDHGYVYQRPQFDFVEGIFELVQRANQQGYKVIVVTNQSGIGRGMYTESDFASLSAWMVAKFAKNGGIIDDVFFCPHHPQAKLAQYKKICECRKPNIGMLKDAAFKYDLSLHNSIMVGDKLSDVKAAIKADLGEMVWLNSGSTEANERTATELNKISLLTKATSVTVAHSLRVILPSGP